MQKTPGGKAVVSLATMELAEWNRTTPALNEDFPVARAYRLVVRTLS